MENNKLSKLSKEFTPGQWVNNNVEKNNTSKHQQMLTDWVVSESERIAEETKQITEKWKKESDYRLKERMVDIQFLTDELLEQKKNTVLEEEALLTYKMRLESALNTFRSKIDITKECIHLREHREGVDMVKDQVKRNLETEIAVFLSATANLDKALKEIAEELRRMKAITYQLEQDIECKQMAHDIDEASLSYGARVNPQHATGAISRMANTTPMEWKEHSFRHIELAEREMANAAKLRSYVDVLLKQVIEDIERQVSRTNEAFRIRIAEYRHAREVLEQTYKQACTKVNDNTMAIEMLHKELSEKESYWNIVTTRLKHRNHRPGVELCRDDAHLTLEREYEVLNESMEKLKNIIAEAERVLRYLIHSQVLTQEEINLKTSTLKIDEFDCLAIRNGLDFSPF